MPTCTFIGSIIDGVFQVSASLLRAYSEAGIGVVLAAGRGHSEPVQIFPAARGQVGLRLAQYRCHADSSQRLVLARKLVMGKIEHQALWLETHGGDARLKHFAEGASQAPDLATLMGMERAASARYFAVWGTLWQVPWSFNGRNRRPPRDPINALLSLGYALALKLCRPNGGIAWVGPGGTLRQPLWQTVYDHFSIILSCEEARAGKEGEQAATKRTSGASKELPHDFSQAREC